MSDNKIERNRTAHAETCRDLVRCLFGLGISPGKIEMQRIDNHPGERVRFDIVIGGSEVLFESKTSDELRQIIVGIEKTKEIVQRSELDFDRLFHIPGNGHVYDAVARSFHDKGLAEYVLPSSANSNVRDHGRPAQIAASATQAPVREKNPNRQAAGRVNALKRYAREPGVAVPQVTTSAASGPAKATAPAPASKRDDKKETVRGRVPDRVAARFAARRNSRR